jgi:hypothetical protein
MAQKPDGKAAKTERVTFTRPAAERIAKVVRAVEGGNRDTAPLVFGARVGGSSAKIFRVATFAGAWSIGSAKTVTFRNQTTTPNTVSATNLFWPIPDGPQRDCAIARDGTAWYLLTPQLYAANAATAATITTAALEFKTLPVLALATASTAAFSVSISTCSTATAS